ncbi:chromate transporter [Treponema pectinovorum]|uniref:chromate transporter n=1 Tax=Treponema pectinovorum TaxID=164 RepID=UPI0011C8BECA|nr:chromate transporter [Treponema pectinovorum]
MEKKINILWQLFCLLFKVGLFTFGGGIAMLPILERELVEKRGWTTSNELLDWFAIGQSTPGIIAVNVSTFIGYKKAGVVGACVATFAMVLPSIIIITIIAIFINNFAELLWVQKALRGINVAVAAILTNAVYKFAKKSVKDAFGFFLLVLAFVLIFVLKVPTVCVIFGSCVPGLVILLFKEKLLHRKSKKE